MLSSTLLLLHCLIQEAGVANHWVDFASPQHAVLYRLGPVVFDVDCYIYVLYSMKDGSDAQKHALVQSKATTGR